MRSLWKGSFTDPELKKGLRIGSTLRRELERTKTHYRNSSILPKHLSLGLVFGKPPYKKNKKIRRKFVTRRMFTGKGFKLGDFIATRAIKFFTKKVKKKKK
jgi:ribosomal protein S19